jgi:hypothetical protein
MLGHNRTLQLLENHWMADHATAPVDVAPLLMMDMYEHAFAMDYGAAAANPSCLLHQYPVGCRCAAAGAEPSPLQDDFDAR